MDQDFLAFKQVILNETSLLGSKELDISKKEKLVSKLVDPLSRQLRNISGEDYVKTMSDKAVDYFLDFARYYHKYGNSFNSFYMYDSQ